MTDASARPFVVVPCLNEALAIRKLLEGVLAHCRDVIVIDDGSTDDTPNIAEVREALDLDESHPIVLCDARYKESVKSVVLSLLELLIVEFKKRASRPSEGRRSFR